MIHFLKVATPIILSLMINYLMPMTDLLMIAHLGMIHVAAVSISMDFYTVFSIVPAGIAYGLQPFIEKPNRNTIGQNTKWFYSSLCINLLGAMIFGGGLLYMIHWLPCFKQDAQAIVVVPYYMPWLALSIFPGMVYNTCCRYLEGLEDTKPVFITTVLGFVSNIVLNYWLIHISVGYFSHVLIGAGLATFCGRCIMALALIPYVWKRLDTRFKCRFSCSYLNSQNIKKLLTLGVPIGIQLFLEFFFFSLTGLMIGSLGAAYKGANAILDNIVSIPISITWGFSLAASILVKQTWSTQQGEGQSVGLYYGVPSIVVGVLAVFIIRYAFFLFTVCYKGSTTDYALIYSSIPLAVLFMFVDVFYTISLGLLRGLRDTFFPFLISTLSNWLIGVPLCYVFIKIMDWGIPSVWLCKIVAFLVSASVLFFRFLKKYPKCN